MTPARRRLERFALLTVPAPWREDVRCDVVDEAPNATSSTLRLIAIVTVGLRLRAARVADGLRDGGWRSAFFRGRSPMREFRRDISFAVRGILRRPGYAVAIIATLAVGIGANTAIFSVFNWILFRPLPAVAQPSELVTIRFQIKAGSGSYFMPYLDYAELRDKVGAFAGTAASLSLQANLATSPGEDGSPGEVELVTSNYLSVLGVVPAPGRDFMASEEHTVAGVPPAIISHRLWLDSFDGDRAVLGRNLLIDGRPFAIVGVAPRRFQGTTLVETTEAWVPVGAFKTVMPHYDADTLTSRRGSLFGGAFARLRPGVTLAEAQTEAKAMADGSADFATRGPKRNKTSIRPVLYAGLGHEAFAQQRLTAIFSLLMGAVGLILLLACANAANLLLARTAARRREIAVCQAIGASRFRIVRQQLAEGLVLSVAAGVAGLGLAAWLTSLFNGMKILVFLPVVEGVAVDWRVCAFAFVASLLTGILFSTVPAITGSRVDLQSSLKDGVTVSRQGRRVLRGGLVTLQVTVSVLLLVAAGLFARTLQNIRSLDLGIDPQRLVGFEIHPSRLGYEPARSQRTLADAVERLRATPGISSAAFTWMTPFGSGRGELSMARPDAPDTFVSAVTGIVSPNYFRTMGIPILAGRDFTDAEFGRRTDTSGLVILSRATAQQLFPNGGAVGSRLLVEHPPKMEVQVVGVVGDVRGRPITDDPEPMVYEPAGQRWPATWGSIVVRSDLPGDQTAAAVRSVVKSIDPAFPPPRIESFSQMIDGVLSEQRLFARLSGLFAVVAALLAAIGIYAMMAGAVAERRREFGIRLALGARHAMIARLVVRQAVLLGGVGVLAGLAGAATLRKLVESRLFGVSSADPLTLLGAGAAVVMLCIAASLVPALRAAAVDPLAALRHE